VRSKSVKIEPNNRASKVYENKVMKNHHGGVLLVAIICMGIPMAAAGCVRTSRPGDEVWSERSKLGKGAISCADGMLYCLDERSGMVVLIEASSKGWQEHGRFKLEPQTKIRSSSGGI